jgi:hypothetical protein
MSVPYAFEVMHSRGNTALMLHTSQFEGFRHSTVCSATLYSLFVLTSLAAILQDHITSEETYMFCCYIICCETCDPKLLYYLFDLSTYGPNCLRRVQGIDANHLFQAPQKQLFHTIDILLELYAVMQYMIASFPRC